MDGFHTSASNRCGLSFSAFEVAAARSSPLAAMEKVTMMLTANARNVALHPGGFFTARSLGNARVRSQARRLLRLSEGFRSAGLPLFGTSPSRPRVDSLSRQVRDGEVAVTSASGVRYICVDLSAALNVAARRHPPWDGCEVFAHIRCQRVSARRQNQHAP